LILIEKEGIPYLGDALFSMMQYVRM
jgi:hypothetical protein